MKPFLFLTAILFAGMFAKAQHNHFVYLQADNKQPFYVKLKENVYSSSASGYLIIPKLQAGTHNLSVGFPKNQWPEQTIPVTISGKDLGYLLKNFDGKGWGLFNIQTMDVIMASTAGGSSAPATKPDTKTDEFSTALADVVNTPSIKEIKEEKKPAPVKKEEPVAVIPVSNPVETTKTPEKAPEPVKETPAAPKTVIKKIRSAQTGEASNITYLISDEFGSDTVDISIPVDKTAPAEVKTEEIKEIKPVEPPKVKETAKSSTPANGDPKFIEIELPNPNKASEVTAPKEPVKEPVKAVKKEEETAKAAPLTMINSDCKTVATDEDFMKTRKKMTAQKSDDDMVNAAKKLFKQKCYSTAQVKNLSVLFLKDDGKYKFFDAVYPFVYDSREFKQLESQLTEEYYISRFRSMIRN